MGYKELSADVTGPDAHDGQLHDPLPYDVGEGAAVHEHAPQLVDAGLTWERHLHWLCSPGTCDWKLIIDCGEKCTCVKCIGLMYVYGW